MDPATQQVKLEDLDFFTLLGLDNLADEEKAKRVAEIQEVVLTDFLQEDLPGLISEEERKEFDALAADPTKGAELEGWLRQKIPNFDQVMLEKMLVAKKELMRGTMLTRLEIAQPGEKETLQKIITAIDSDDWGQASSLIASL